jgi:hypothetical protein
MHKQQKLLDILLGWLITSVEDMKVKPEHREDRTEDTFEDKTHQQVALLVMETEAENCGYTLSDGDRRYLAEEVARVAWHVRTPQAGKGLK